MKPKSFILLLLLVSIQAAGQNILTGEIRNAATTESVPGATVSSVDSSFAVLADANGKFSIPSKAFGKLIITAVGFHAKEIITGNKEHFVVVLSPLQQEMEAVVITGTMKAVRKSESPVAVEVYTPQFFKKNPSPSIFESLQNVNGVRPQLNCNVCNTGDIHINGLEGPYTMVTIDGMPIVSSLASVYGLFGIPTQLIDRVEIVKGPASGLYGSEAIGGLINIITKTPDKAPKIAVNVMGTSWNEYTLDFGAKINMGKKISSLLGVNYYNYQQPSDKNNDNFTDVTLQHRVSVFNKIQFARKNSKIATVAGRYFTENRWGGEMQWSRKFRGTDSIYGESISTRRWEAIGNYQLPVNEKIIYSFSATGHHQESWYGNIPFMAKQRIVFNQLTWDKQAGASHNLLIGTSLRNNFYDDNSTATRDTLTGINKPDRSAIPSLFLQDEWTLSPSHLLLLGLRFDHHPVHGFIFTPRFAWKWTLKNKQIFRLNAGTGFRVVNLFTEEHAALTGARSVEIKESLNPERSININLNYSKGFYWNGTSLNFDASVWYSHFGNQIIPDYDSDPNKIIYRNLNGYATSRGATLNIELNIGHRFKSLVGTTIQDVARVDRLDNGNKSKFLPVLTEKWSGTWLISYVFSKAGITIDYTGNLYGPMRLPLLSATDPRPAYSPVWSIQNLQVTKLLKQGFELFCGVKNLLNWTPTKKTPFIIARSHDPFDKKVKYDSGGNILATPENPYALSFDPSYVYAPNQGIRFFGGIRVTVKK